MFLTQIRLNPERRRTRCLTSSPQKMHAAVLGGAHPEVENEVTGRVLWRLDRGLRHELSLYVLSPWRPELKHLVEQAGWESHPDSWQTVDCRPFLSRLEVGQRWAFRLTANPTHNVRLTEGKRTRRLAHVTVRQQEEWLLKRAPRAGFILPVNTLGARELIVRDRRTLKFYRGENRKGPQVTLGVATFDGVLEVADAEALRRVLINGLGRAKAYGCGLMTLADLTSS